MSTNKNHRHHDAGLLLLLAIVGLHSIGDRSRSPRRASFSEKARIFVAVTGAIENPGVYGFSQKPHLDELAKRAGINSRVSSQTDSLGARFPSGSQIQVLCDGSQTHIRVGQMTAFHKLTLGISISLNHERSEGLTALPGIGPRLANAIVTERAARNGFSAVGDLLSVPGISQRLYRKIRPYVRL